MTFWAPCVSFVVSVLVTALLRSGRLAQMALDHPNERSLHSRPVPRTGGVGVMLGILSGSLLIIPELSAVLWYVMPLVLVSLYEDLAGLPIVLRLSAHLVVTAIFCLQWACLPFPWWVVMAFAVAWMANLYNFMDGSDGLAGGMAAIGFGAYGLAAWAQGDPAFAYFVWCAAAAAAGFLIFNFAPASIFFGDVGSIPLGFLAGALGLAGVIRDVWSWWFPIAVFAPFVVDATATLLRRLVRREKVWQAHRDHYYQRLIRMGWSHRRTAFAEYVLMLASGFAAVMTCFLSGVGRIGVLVLVGMVILGSMRLIDRKWARMLTK